MLNFRGWSQPQNYFNSQIFLIYGIVLHDFDDIMIATKHVTTYLLCGVILMAFFVASILHIKVNELSKFVMTVASMQMIKARPYLTTWQKLDMIPNQYT